METWSSRLGVGRGADDPTPAKKQQLGNLRCGLGTVRSMDRDDWEKSIKEVKVRIGLYSHLRRRRRRRRRIFEGAAKSADTVS
jgi:hypothetical protein